MSLVRTWQLHQMNLQEHLPELFPVALAWAQFQAEHVATVGVPLPEHLVELARQVGVREPQLIRVKLVDDMPVPVDPMLKSMAEQTGLLSPDTAGLTLGYSIFLRHGQDSIRLLSHEFRHVYQYEFFGSIDAFLRVYLLQLATVGYKDAPLEQDARSFEVTTI